MTEAVTVRLPEDAPRLVGRAPEDYAQELQDFLKTLLFKAVGGIPPGFNGVTPAVISADSVASPGSQEDGWLSAGATFAIDTSGTPGDVTLGPSTQGAGSGLLRSGATVHLPSELYDHDLAWLRPDAADAADDEFRDASIDAAWDHMDNGQVLPWIELGDVISARNDGTSDAVGERHGLVKDIAGLGVGSYVQAAIRLLGDYPGTSRVGYGVCFTNSNHVWGDAGSKQVCGEFYFDATVLPAYYFQIGESGAGLSTLSVITTSTPFIGVFPQIYLRLVWSAVNTFKLLASPDGVSWIEVVPDTASTLTPTGGGLTQGGPSTSSTPYVTAVEHFRVGA